MQILVKNEYKKGETDISQNESLCFLSQTQFPVWLAKSPHDFGLLFSCKTATLGVVSNLGLLIFAKALSSALLKGITEEQRVIIKDDICSLWLKMTKWNFKCRSQHCNLMHKGTFAHLLPATWSPSILQRVFFKFAFKWGLLFKWGLNVSRHHQRPKIYRFCLHNVFFFLFLNLSWAANGAH